MKNIIDYYYNLNINSITKIMNNYYFNYNGNLYMFYLIDYVQEIKDINTKLNLVNKNFHQLVLNKNNEFITFDGHNNYILMKINIKTNKIITFCDLLEFKKNNILIENKTNNWIKLWKEKIDYLEYYINTKESTDEKIKSCINYYIGLSENALKYLQLYAPMENMSSYVHKRIESTYTLYDLYNPLHVIIDFPERDIAEYIKSLFYNNNINVEKLKSIIKKSNEFNLNYELIFARLLFPTYLYDIFDSVEVNKLDKNKIIFAYNKTHDFERILGIIYEEISKIKKIPSISWIKR